MIIKKSNEGKLNMLLKIINFLMPFWGICGVIALLVFAYTSFRIFKIKRKYRENFNSDVVYDDFNDVDVCFSIVAFLGTIVRILVVFSSILYMFVLLKEKWLIAIMILLVTLFSKMSIPMVVSIVAAYVTKNNWCLLYGALYYLIVNLLLFSLPLQLVGLIMDREKEKERREEEIPEIIDVDIESLE